MTDNIENVEQLHYYNYIRPSDSQKTVLVTMTQGLTSYTGTLNNGESVTNMPLCYEASSKNSVVRLQTGTSDPTYISGNGTALYYCGPADDGITERNVYIRGGSRGDVVLIKTTAFPSGSDTIKLKLTNASNTFEAAATEMTLVQDGRVYSFSYNGSNKIWQELQTTTFTEVIIPYKTKPLIPSYMVAAYFTPSGMISPTLDTWHPMPEGVGGWTPGMPNTPDLERHPTDPSKMVYRGIFPKLMKISAITNVEIEVTDPLGGLLIEYVWAINGVYAGMVRKQSLHGSFPFHISSGNGVLLLYPGDTIEPLYRLSTSDSPVPNINFLSNTFTLEEFVNYFEAS